MKKKLTLGAVSALVMLATGAMAEEAKFGIAGFAIEGNTLLPESTIQGVLASHQGADKTLQDINAAADALRKTYEDAGYPVVQVFPPAQTASGGTIALKVVEGKIQTVAVKGNKAYDEANIRASLPPLKEGEKPNAKEIIAAIAAANENPAKQLAVNFQAAPQIGDIDATITVTEDQPEKYLLNIDNMGSKSTGIHRLSLGYQNANLFNRDHMLTLQVGTSIDYPDRSLSVSGGYRIPFYGTGLSLDLIGAYSDSSSTTNVGFGTNQFNGKGITFGLRLNQALPSVGVFRHKLIYGFDYKDFDNTCNQLGTTCGTITTQPLSVTYFAQIAQPEYQLSGSASLVANVPGGKHGSGTLYDKSRSGASEEWQALRLSANLAVPLPEDFQFRAALSGQLTDSRLVAGEQFGIGGASSVRGYIERTATGDTGYSGNVELYSPDFGKHVAEGTSLRALAFYDFGEASYNRALNNGAEKKYYLSSFGTGLRLNVGRDVAVKFDVGVAQNAFPNNPATDAGRSRGDTFAHAAFNLSF
jgi:hemolysin activation/secretion protein